MGDRIYGDIDRILKSEAPNDEVKTKISDMSKQELTDIIADNIEQLSSSDTSGSLTENIAAEDVSEIPQDDEVTEDETPDEEEKSKVEKLVEQFYELRGALTPIQKRDLSDLELLEQARDKADEENPDDKLTDDDLDKAKSLISLDLEGRGDLIGNP